jgi:hypothetical protein
VQQSGRACNTSGMFQNPCALAMACEPSEVRAAFAHYATTAESMELERSSPALPQPLHHHPRMRSDYSIDLGGIRHTIGKVVYK